MSMELTDLDGVLFEASLDPVKTDLEMRCRHCDQHLCDIEHGDDLQSLAGVALGHHCEPLAGDRFRLVQAAAGLWRKEVSERAEVDSPFTDEYMRGMAELIARATQTTADEDGSLIDDLILRVTEVIQRDLSA